MAFFNYVTKEITLKVVYYGPGLSGKTTNLQHLYSLLDPSLRGKFISLSTESDRTLFFDFLPVDLGKIKDFSVRFQLYTVPGQIRYNATRKLVLKGADAVVFVADSQREIREQNTESFTNMRDNLISNNLNPDEIPVVFQYNKRDLPDILSVEELNSDLNVKGYQVIEATAVNGRGVEETFRMITKILLKDIVQKHKKYTSPDKKRDISIRIPEKSAPVIEERHSAQAVSEHGNVITLSQPISEARNLADENLNHLMTILPEIRQSLSVIQERLSVLYGEMKETDKQQAGIMKTLEEIKSSLNHAKRKRRWFHIIPK